ncbi:hypothetical protein V2A60_003025 [Cordyceps javanica]|uniref:Peptidase S1/S6, chymotrypsin/Hap, active site protein n=1 Tax=Cordyceps javanica TaxID=43265 RepID=A0A545V4F0_9HYPO|nr:Peptidase S1/S6, chymotrypsin/Hap, active site protein [Cordyceps javanica]TQW07866.1 Peptidase S1/S6, chymotrypsin/Hap, active site protein [Cordyceps javanica]
MHRLAACLVAAAVATAAPAATETIVEHLYTNTTVEDQRIRSYWTPERIETLHDDPLLPASFPLPFEERPYGNEFGDTQSIVRTVGRILSTVFLTNGTAQDGSCTGTLLNSRNGAVVVTAGHCIFGAPSGVNGTWLTNLLFIPGFRDGSGVANFTVNRGYISSHWEASPGFEGEIHDRAFLVLNPDPASNSDAESVLGTGRRIKFTDAAPEQPYKRRWLFGYPRSDGAGAQDHLRYGTPAFTGRRLATCNGTPGLFGPDPSMLQVACYMSGGASGGPIMEDFDANTGKGSIVAVNTFTGSIYDEYKQKMVLAMVGTPVTNSFSKKLFSLAESIIPVLV